MEFHEKLQRLRSRENLTQEELAEKLYVSRTAISKWESGRGYPSIDSLKAVAKYFHVTVDELISGEEMVSLAEQDRNRSHEKTVALICGILDCLIVLLLFLPVFGDGRGSVSLPAMTGVRGWLKAVFLIAVSLTAVNGFCTVVLGSFDRPVWIRHRLITGMALSVVGTVIFIAARQPYAAIYFLCLLIAKGILTRKGQ